MNSSSSKREWALNAQIIRRCGLENRARISRNGLNDADLVDPRSSPAPEAS